MNDSPLSLATTNHLLPHILSHHLPKRKRKGGEDLLLSLLSSSHHHLAFID